MDYSYPLLCACERNGDRVALVAAGYEPVTYRALEARIAGLAAALRGMQAGGTRLFTSRAQEFVEDHFACPRCRTEMELVPGRCES